MIKSLYFILVQINLEELETKVVTSVNDALLKYQLEIGIRTQYFQSTSFYERARMKSRGAKRKVNFIKGKNSYKILKVSLIQKYLRKDWDI